MSAAKSARRLTRAAFVLGLLATSPLAAQPAGSEPAPVEATPVDAAPAAPAATAPPTAAPAQPAPADAAATPPPAAPPAAAPAPTANPRQQIAKELFERGRQKWKLGEHDEAVSLLTASNQQSERAGTLLVLGESLELLGRLRSAHSAFERAVEVARRENDPVLEARAATRTAALAPMIPQMEIRFTVPPPDGTLVTLNGVELPREWLNRAVDYDAGEYRLDVRAPGHALYSAQIVLTNEAARLGVQVVPVTLTALSQPEPEPLPLFPIAPVTPEDTGLSTRRRLAWISGGMGAAAALTGVTLLLVALDKKRDASDQCRESESGGDDPCTPQGMRLRRRAKQLADLATVSAAVSGVSLATSFTLFVTSEQSATPTGAGIRYGGTF